MGKDETLATIWEIPDHLWEQIHPVILDLDPPPGYGAQTRRPQADAGRHHLPDAQWLSVEPSASGTGRRQHYPPDLPALGGAWSAGGHLGCSGGGLRGTGRSGLGMAVGGLLHGQGPFGGGAIGRNPTDRGKAGSKKSILVDAAGGTPERGGGWSQRP